jgi:RNA polymerase sigma factor (TIGR02999 family)
MGTVTSTDDKKLKPTSDPATSLILVMRCRGSRSAAHEAYLNIRHRGGLVFPDQWRFLAYAARAMRGVAIDRARERARLKRGGDITITSLDTENAEQYAQPEQLPRISEAFDELALLEPELAHIVDLKFFCGFTLAQIAALKKVSERTMQRHWEKARLMLYRALTRD